MFWFGAWGRQQTEMRQNFSAGDVQNGMAGHVLGWRAIWRASGRASEPVGVRASGRAGERVDERASTQAGQGVGRQHTEVRQVACDFVLVLLTICSKPAAGTCVRIALH